MINPLEWPIWKAALYCLGAGAFIGGLIFVTIFIVLTLSGCPPENPAEWDITRPRACYEVVKNRGRTVETRDLQFGIICKSMYDGWSYDNICINVPPSCTP